MPLGGRLGEIDSRLAFHEDAAAAEARGATYYLSTLVACRATVELARNKLQLLSKDGTHPGTRFAATCKELFGEAFEDKEAWLSKCVANVVSLKKFCKLLKDTDIKIGCGEEAIQVAYTTFVTLLDDFGEKSSVASQYLASDVSVCYYDYKKTGFVEAFASCMAENLDFTTQRELQEYCEERQQAAALLTLSVKVGCTLSELDGWEGKVSGYPKMYRFRAPSGLQYRSLEKAAEAAASLLSESETETESSNKRGRPDDDDDDDDAPSSKRPRRSELHSLLVRLCKVGKIPYEDQMDTATLSLLVRTRLAQNPSDGVDVANTICSLVPNGAVAVAGTLFLRALGV